MEKTKDPAQTMINNLLEKTGKTLEQWLTILKKAGFSSATKHGEILKCLKDEFGISHGFANLIAHKLRESGANQEDNLVDLQYQNKESLVPIYDKLISSVSKFGKDVEVSPKKGYVSLRRSKQFAIVQPSTKTRVDVGLNLKGEKPNQRLEASGSFNAMVSHRVRVTNIKEIDAELIGWLKRAYQSA